MVMRRLGMGSRVFFCARRPFYTGRMFQFRDLTESDIQWLFSRYPEVVGDPEERREALMKRLSDYRCSGTLSVEDACFLMPLQTVKDALKENNRRAPSDEADIRSLLLEVLTEKQSRKTAFPESIYDPNTSSYHSAASITRETVPSWSSRAQSAPDTHTSKPSSKGDWESETDVLDAIGKQFKRAVMYLAFVAIPVAVLYMGAVMPPQDPCRKCNRRHYQITNKFPLSMLSEKEHKEYEMKTCYFNKFTCLSCRCTYITKHPKNGQKPCPSCNGYTLKQAIHNQEQVEECQFCGTE